MRGITIINQPRLQTYLFRQPNLEGLIFSQSFPGTRSIPDAVQFAAKYQMALQSAREAAAVRLEADKWDNADKAQVTRTTATYFLHDDEQYYVAFDDDIHPEANILLMRAIEGHTAHQSYGKWLLPREDEQVKLAIQRAEGSQRIVRVEHTAEEDSLILRAKEYRTHPTSIAILGDQTGPYDDYLAGQQRERRDIFLVSPGHLRRMGVTKNVVEIRPVVLSGGGSIATILADQYIHQCSAWARGVYQQPV